MSEFLIPPATLRVLELAPPERATLLLLRHSARGPLPVGEPGNDVLLLPEGKALGRELGGVVGSRLRTLHASPVRRCVETAEAIIEGAGVDVEIAEDRALGHPGVYVEDGDAAWSAWQALGHEGVMKHLVAGDRLDGLADPIPATRRLLDHMHARAGGAAGVHIFVTHDSLVTVAAAHCLRRALGRADWPLYLEALVLAVDGDRITASYRDWSEEVRWG